VDASAEVPLLAWYDLDDEWLTKVRQIHDAVVKDAARIETLPRGSVLPRASVELGPPVPRPGKIVCVGLNYKDHAAESNMAVPASPVTFSKYVTSVVGPGQPIRLPKASAQVDYEAELAVVIGRRAKHVPVERAFEYVLGYMNLNDVSARDLQFADGQWQRGKSCDSFAPMGPYIVTRDAAGVAAQAGIGAEVVAWCSQATFVPFVLLRFGVCCTPSTKRMPARTSGNRCAPSSRRHRPCAMSSNLCAIKRPFVQGIDTVHIPHAREGGRAQSNVLRSPGRIRFARSTRVSEHLIRVIGRLHLGVRFQNLPLLIDQVRDPLRVAGARIVAGAVGHAELAVGVAE